MCVPGAFRKRKTSVALRSELSTPTTDTVLLLLRANLNFFFGRVASVFFFALLFVFFFVCEAAAAASAAAARATIMGAELAARPVPARVRALFRPTLRWLLR